MSSTFGPHWSPSVRRSWASSSSLLATRTGGFCLKYFGTTATVCRIPMSGSDESSHIPPYPMKLAPPDNRDVDPDTQVSEV